MSHDSEVALIGTGVAPLVAANYLISQGKSVLILNPDLDFFLEDSELPLDPLLHGKISTERILQNSIKNSLEVIRPVFPGPIEIWPKLTEKAPNRPDYSEYHDPSAPHLRQRGRLWISSFPNSNQLWDWERLEDLYVETSDANLNPQILEGLPAIRRFPGASANTESFRGLHIPRLCDIDVSRYRNGLLEYIREKLEPKKVVCSVNQLEVIPGGVRFHAQGTLNTAKIKESLLVFWTPRLNSWITGQAKRLNRTIPLPQGLRIWEQWSLNSREQPNPSTIGMFEDMAVWAEIEGAPHDTPQIEAARLAVLRSGPLIAMHEIDSPQASKGWASGESFGSLTRLCHDFLKWDRFSIRSLKARAIFEWDTVDSWLLSPENPQIQVINGCDGPLTHILRNVRSSCETLLGSKL